MALAVRGWGLEVALALGIFGLWRLGVALDGEGMGVLFLGIARHRLLAQPPAHAAGWPPRCGTGRPRGGSPGCWSPASSSAAAARFLGSRASRRSRPGGACICASRLASAPRCSTRRASRWPPPSAPATSGSCANPTNASLAHVSILSRDPLSAPAPPWPVPQGSLWEPLSLGVDEDGKPVSIGLPERNLLLGGEPGAGKSVALSLFIAAAALDPAVTLTLLDGKQVELAPWSGSAEHFVGPDMAGAIERPQGPLRRDGPPLRGPVVLGAAQDRAGR